MTTWKDTWVRIAGNAKRIRTEGDPFHWRCYPRREGPEIPIRSFRLDGPASAANVAPGTDPAAANALGLTAWIDFYGDLEIVDETARIVLKPR